VAWHRPPRRREVRQASFVVAAARTAAGSPTGAPGFDGSLFGFGAVHKVGTAVLLPAILVVLGADRPVFAVRDGRNPVGGDTEVDEEVLGCGGAPVTQTEVILLASTLVAVTLDRELDVRVSLQEIAVTGQSRFSVRANVGLVEVEVRILHILREGFFVGHFLRRWWRRRRGVNHTSLFSYRHMRPPRLGSPGYKQDVPGAAFSVAS